MLEQIGGRFERTQIVDAHYLNIGALGFRDRTQDMASDTAKTVDCHANSHALSPLFTPAARRARRDCCQTGEPGRAVQMPWSR
jgi:hypothetical protein